MKNQKGSVMVETVIVFPIVLMTVFVMLYLSLFKLQEMAMLYEVQRVAHQGAKIAAYPGYDTLGEYKLKTIDFSTDPEDVNEYYKAYHSSLARLYREIAGPNAWDAQTKVDELMQEVAKSVLILAGGSLVENNVEIQRGFFSTKVKAEAVFQMKMPGVLKFFMPDAGSIYEKRQSASATVMNPGDFLRFVDLTTDVVSYVTKELGGDETLDKMKKGLNEFVNFVF